MIAYLACLLFALVSLCFSVAFAENDVPLHEIDTFAKKYIPSWEIIRAINSGNSTQSVSSNLTEIKASCEKFSESDLKIAYDEDFSKICRSKLNEVIRAVAEKVEKIEEINKKIADASKKEKETLNKIEESRKSEAVFNEKYHSWIVEVGGKIKSNSQISKLLDEYNSKYENNNAEYEKMVAKKNALLIQLKESQEKLSKFEEEQKKQLIEERKLNEKEAIEADEIFGRFSKAMNNLLNAYVEKTNEIECMKTIANKLKDYDSICDEVKKNIDELSKIDIDQDDGKEASPTEIIKFGHQKINIFSDKTVADAKLKDYKDLVTKLKKLCGDLNEKESEINVAFQSLKANRKKQEEMATALKNEKSYDGKPSPSFYRKHIKNRMDSLVQFSKKLWPFKK